MNLAFEIDEVGAVEFESEVETDVIVEVETKLDTECSKTLAAEAGSKTQTCSKALVVVEVEFQIGSKAQIAAGSIWALEHWCSQTRLQAGSKALQASFARSKTMLRQQATKHLGPCKKGSESHFDFAGSEAHNLVEMEFEKFEVTRRATSEYPCDRTRIWLGLRVVAEVTPTGWSIGNNRQEVGSFADFGLEEVEKLNQRQAEAGVYYRHRPHDQFHRPRAHHYEVDWDPRQAKESGCLHRLTLHRALPH